MQREPKRVLAVVSDLYFSVKISEAAKRNGLALEFVKDSGEVLEKAKEKPSLIVFDLNFEAVDPLKLIAKLNQPMLIVTGQLDTQFPTPQADRLESLFRVEPQAAAADLGQLVEETRALVLAELADLELPLRFPPKTRQRPWST